MGELMARMSELHARVAEGGPQKAKEKHVARGKMLAREYVRGTCRISLSGCLWETMTVG